MNWTITIAWFAVIGAALELVGIWLTVQDLRKAAMMLRLYDKAGHSLWVAPFPAHLRASGALTVTGGTKPSVDQRLSRIEAEVSDLPNRLAQLEDRLRTEWQNSITGAMQASENTVNDRITKLRNYILGDRSISTGSMWWLGPSIVALGIVFGYLSDFLSAIR